jgi:hypothetical protein
LLEVLRKKAPITDGEVDTVSGRALRCGGEVVSGSRWAHLHPRRRLQLVLAAVWLWDGVLQYQPFMFTPAFARQLLAPTARGNPALIAHPITFAAGIIADHPLGTNAAFATIQLLLGCGIAWKPTVKTTLAASIVWSLAVWWFGEGLGGVLTGTGNPLSGAPGAVLLYGLLAVLLWPPHTDTAASSAFGFVAAQPVGVRPARVVWLLVWSALAFFAALPANRTPGGLRDMISQMASGQPGWLATVENTTARLTDSHGGPVSIVFAVVLAAIALGVFLRPRPLRVVLAVAVVMAAVIWVIGEGLGAPFGGQATDLNSGPLLALLTAAYWPIRSPRPASDTTTPSHPTPVPEART